MNLNHIELAEVVTFAGMELPQNLPRSGDDKLSPSRTCKVKQNILMYSMHIYDILEDKIYFKTWH